jgi:hypothetical protein
MLFGKSIDLDKGIFIPLEDLPPPDGIEIVDWVIERAKATSTILERANQTQLAIQNHEIEKRLAKVSQNPSPPVLIDVGRFCFTG